MKKSVQLFAGLFFTVCAIPVIFSSCVDPDYYMGDDGIDLTLQVGGDSLSLPLGSTKIIMLDSLLGTDLMGDILITDANGNYVFAPDNVSVETEMEGIAGDAFNINDVHQEKIFPVYLGASSAGRPAPTPGSARKDKVPVYAQINETLGLDFDFVDIPDAVSALTQLTFKEGTNLHFELSVSEIPSFIDVADVAPELLISFPSMFVFNDNMVNANNEVNITAFNQGDRFVYDCNLSGIDLSGVNMENGELHLSDTIYIRGDFVWYSEAVPGKGSRGESAGYEVDLKVSSTVEDIVIDRVDGRFAVEVEPQNFSFSLGEMPDLLSSPGTVLDFDNPYMMVDLTTNSGVPFNAVFSMKPVNGGVPDESLAATVNLHVDGGEPGVDRTLHFYLARNNMDMPEGYTFYPFDLAPMLRHLPDEFAATVTAETDNSVQSEYVFGQAVSVKADVAPRIPLAFGEDLHIQYDDTMQSMPDLLSKILDGNQLEVVAEIENSMPLNIMLNIDVLDEFGEVIPVSKSGAQLIRSCNRYDEAQTSQVSFMLSGVDGVLNGRTVSSIHLDCALEGGEEVAGKPLNKKGWFRAKLKANIPGGIRVNLDDLGNDKE